MEAQAIVSSLECYEPSNRIRTLYEKGAGVPLSIAYPIKRYYNSGQEMLRVAKVYMKEGDLENAYLIYIRYMTIFLEKIREHPEYPQVDSEQRSKTRNMCKEVFPIAEQIKEQLKSRYEREYEEKRQAAAARLHQIKVQEEAMRKPKNDEATNRAHNEDKLQELLNERIQSKLNELDKEKDKMKCSKSTAYSPTPSPSSISQKTLNTSSGPTAPPPDEINRPNIPTFDRSTKPNYNSLLSSQGNDSLRDIIIPASLTEKFLHIASWNTYQNIELCGILAGKFASNDFTITHILIPSQRGTGDSCLTENEEQIFLYQDKYDLITLGWIHTHPSQNAFLSSIDLHTHFSYQIMLPEAIAIVCAPKFTETGVYSLTKDYGLDVIANCKQSGFHYHPKEPPIYENCKHVVFDDKITINVVDLR